MSPRLVICHNCGTPTPSTPCSNCAPHGKASLNTRTYQHNRAETLRTERTCWLCGKPGTPDDPLTADHVKPRAAGGTNDRANLRAAHLSCNQRRGAADPGHGKKSRIDRPPPVRHRALFAVRTGSESDLGSA